MAWQSDCGGVYAIVNMVTGAVYIGSTNNIPYRWTKHFQALRNGYHENDHLQKAFNKYGQDAFDVAVLELTNDADERRAIEQRLLNKYVGDDLCYNIAETADIPNVRTGPKPLTERIRNSEAIRGRVLTELEKEAARAFPKNRMNMAALRVRNAIERDARDRQRDVFGSMLAEYQRLYNEHLKPPKRNTKGWKLPYKARAKQHHRHVNLWMVHKDGRCEFAPTLVAFCQRHGLDDTAMRRMVNGDKPSMYGWRAYHERPNE
jgi:group I intron endonuclease